MSGFAGRPSRVTALEQSEVLFWLGFWTLYAKFMLQATVVVEVPSVLLQTMLLFGMAFLAARVLFVLMQCERRPLIVISLALALVSYFISGETVPLTTFLVLFGAVGMDAKSVIRSWCRATGCILILMLVLWGLDSILGASVFKTFTAIGGLSVERGALLFVHPNYCAAFFFAFAIGYACSAKGGTNSKTAVYAVCLLVIAFIAGSRTSALSLLAFPVLAFLLNRRFFHGHPGAVGVFSVLVPTALLALTLYIAAVWFTGPGYSNELNDLLTGRPTLWWTQWANGGVSLFGREAFEGTVYVYGTLHTASTIDSFYASMLFNDGLAVFACLLVLVWLRFKNGIRGGNAILAAAIASIFVFGFCEWHAFNVFTCIPLVGLSSGIQPVPREALRERREGWVPFGEGASHAENCSHNVV